MGNGPSNLERERQERERAETLRQESERHKTAEKLRQEVSDRRQHVTESSTGKTRRFSSESIDYPSRLNVGLFGLTGVGKTSLLNSIRYAVNGNLDCSEWLQVSPEEFHGGHTMRRQELCLTDHLSFYDNRGIGCGDLQNEMVRSALFTQLEGKSKMGEQVDWGTAHQSANPKPEERKINCTVIVFDARMKDTVIGHFHTLIRFLFEWAGRYPIGVITNIDRANSAQMEKARRILRIIGITDIYEVKNLHENYTCLDMEYQLVLLKMIERCLFLGDEIIQLHYYIEKDH